MKKILIASALAITVLGVQAYASLGTTVIVDYSFNTNGFTGAATTEAQTNAMLTANIGSSISKFTNFNAAATQLTLLSSVSGNPDNHGFPGGNSVSQNAWNGGNSYFQFTLDATGFQNLVLTWTGNVSSTGPTTNTLQYSTDGGSTFTAFSVFKAPDNNATIGTTTQALDSVTSLNNNALDVFRIYGTANGAGAIAAAGTMKIDNFVILADAIPEPSTMFLLGLGLTGLLAIRRRNS